MENLRNLRGWVGCGYVRYISINIIINIGQLPLGGHLHCSSVMNSSVSPCPIEKYPYIRVDQPRPIAIMTTHNNTEGAESDYHFLAFVFLLLLLICCFNLISVEEFNLKHPLTASPSSSPSQNLLVQVVVFVIVVSLHIPPLLLIHYHSLPELNCTSCGYKPQ